MNSEEQVRQAHRTPFQRFFLDPLIALPAFTAWGIFKVLPAKIAARLGESMGAFIGLFLKRRNHIGLVNLRIAFPKKTEAERRLILRKMWRHWGRFYAEMPHTKTLFKQASFSGLEHLKQAHQNQTGGFVCSAHLGNWELAVSQPLFDNFYLNPVYRRANNPWLDKLMFQRRTGILIPKGITGARKMMKVLRDKGFIVMLCDQKLREGISVPLFGKPAMTPTAIAVMALKMKLPIIMARSIRKPDGTFLMDISKPLPIPETKDTDKAVYEIMKTINGILEDWIRETPEQWLWVHRRFDKSEYR